MEARSDCGSGGCVTCPFSFNEESEIVQNYGCLPTWQDIIQMKEVSGHNWSCHSNASVLCGGFTTYIKKSRPDLNLKVGNLIPYEEWYREGDDILHRL